MCCRPWRARASESVKARAGRRGACTSVPEKRSRSRAPYCSRFCVREMPVVRTLRVALRSAGTASVRRPTHAQVYAVVTTYSGVSRKQCPSPQSPAGGDVDHRGPDDPRYSYVNAPSAGLHCPLPGAPSRSSCSSTRGSWSARRLVSVAKALIEGSTMGTARRSGVATRKERKRHAPCQKAGEAGSLVGAHGARGAAALENCVWGVFVGHGRAPEDCQRGGSWQQLAVWVQNLRHVRKSSRQYTVQL